MMEIDKYEKELDETFFFDEGQKHQFISTYCHVKLPLMPSLRRSRRERCLLGPEPIGIAFAPFDDDDDVILLKMDRAVGLPDEEVECAVSVCC